MQTPNFAHQMPPMQSTSGATTLLRPPFPPPLTMADHVASVCRSAYIATDSTDTAITVGQYCNCASVHFQSPATRFCTASPTTLSSVCSQFRMLITRNRSSWTHHTRSAGATLAADSTRYRVQAGYAAVQDTATPYLSRRCQLVSDADRRLRSSAALSCVVPWTRTRLGDWSFDVAGPWVCTKLSPSMRLTEDFWYLSRFCTLLTSVPGRHLLRSSDANKLLVPRSCTTNFGLHSFCSSGPTAWNDMPAHLHNLDLPLSDFRQLLKTALFQTVPV